MVLYDTHSICPICLKTIKAAYVNKENTVYLEKTCEEHGSFSCLIARDAADFAGWSAQTVNIRPRAARPAGAGCPHDCGPCTNHMQTACCVLLDVTDRCNQHCGICFASASPSFKSDPPLAEIERRLEVLLRLSEERKFNIQLSGGEPTVREDLPQIVKMAKDKGFEYVQLNTNGKRIGQEEGYASILKKAGVDAVFMQFDGTTEEIYEQLRNERLLAVKKKAVQSCRRAKLPVALVPTLVRGVNDQNIGAMVDYMLENVDVIKGIHFQPVSLFGRYQDRIGEENRFTMFDTIEALEKQTGGLLSKKEMLPISTGHNLCCFYASYIKEEGGVVYIGASKQQDCCGPLAAADHTEYTEGAECCKSSHEDAECCKSSHVSADCCKSSHEGADCCKSSHEGAECCKSSRESADCCKSKAKSAAPCCPPDIEIISKDRDYVLNKWKLAEERSGPEADGFDAFLNHLRQNSFTITGMAFQDAMSLDTQRVQRCRVQVLDGEDRLIPFCAYNITAANGRYLYRRSESSILPR